MDLYTLDVPAGTVFALNCEIENTLKGTVMRLDLLMLVKEALVSLFLGWTLLAGFTCELKVGIKRGFSHQMP